MEGSLPLKYRPTDFEYVYGNDETVKTVQGILKREFANMPKSWLFTGESGTGKTTMVRIMKEHLDCKDANFHEYNSSSDRGIDAIRRITGDSRLSAMGGGNKIFLLDEAHNLTPAGQQALLKVLEDTPPNTFFMLATTDPQKLLKAIKTRCTPVVMKTCNPKVIGELCLDIANEEGIDLSPKIASKIGRACVGSPREALKILDLVIDIEDVDEALAAVEKTIGDVSNGIKVCQEFMGNCNWKAISAILTLLYVDTEPEAIRRMMMGYFNKVALSGDKSRAFILLDELCAMRRLDTEQADVTSACRVAFNRIQEGAGTGTDVPF
jgi:DNA polymerase-3 subunit gamma/tau